MTALKDFERLESLGIWRASADAQRSDVIVSLGDATLTISDENNDSAIAHWSLPAVERINPGKRPALYRPGEDATELLELTDDTLIQAIKKVQSAIERRRPHPGRLRLTLICGVILLIAALAIFWLPGAMINYTASVVPAPKRVTIGENLLANIQRVSGQPCSAPLGQQALGQLKTRLLGEENGKIVVLADGVKNARHLPGRLILLNRSLVEDYEDPEVAAGFILAEDLRAEQISPLLQLLKSVGFVSSFRLLTTGNIPDPALEDYAETLLTSDPVNLSDADILARFAAASVRATPYAYALDISGESTIGLIEADTVSAKTALAVLDDSAWVSLQGICGE